MEAEVKFSLFFAKRGGVGNMLELKGIWIPLEIITNDELTDKEKIIYSMILFLSKDTGCCFCTNSTLRNLLNISSQHATRLISSLKNKNFIRVELKYKNDSKEIENRIIYPLKNLSSSKNVITPVYKYDSTPSILNAKVNKIYNKNNIKEYNSFANFEQRHYTAEDFMKLYDN